MAAMRTRRKDQIDSFRKAWGEDLSRRLVATSRRRGQRGRTSSGLPVSSQALQLFLPEAILSRRGVLPEYRLAVMHELARRTGAGLNEVAGALRWQATWGRGVGGRFDISVQDYVAVCRDSLVTAMERRIGEKLGQRQSVEGEDKEGEEILSRDKILVGAAEILREFGFGAASFHCVLPTGVIKDVAQGPAPQSPRQLTRFLESASGFQEIGKNVYFGFGTPGGESMVLIVEKPPALPGGKRMLDCVCQNFSSRVQTALDQYLGMVYLEARLARWRAIQNMTATCAGAIASGKEGADGVPAFGQAVMDTLQQILPRGTRSLTFLIINPTTGQLRPVACQGVSSEILDQIARERERRLDVNSDRPFSFALRIAEAQSTPFVNMVLGSRDPFPEDLGRQIGAGDAVIIPLYWRNRLLGAITASMYRDRFILPSQLTALEEAAEQISAQLAVWGEYNDLHTFANVDPVTGLYSRRYFDKKLLLFFAEAQRRGLPLAAIMADLDHFKLVNDMYGHAVGDGILRLVGRKMRQQVEQVNFPEVPEVELQPVAARVGGEEFMALILGANIEQASSFAKGLLKVNREARFDTGQREPGGKKIIINKTLSLGIVVFYPGTDYQPWFPAAHMLVNRADAALYGAKGGLVAYSQFAAFSSRQEGVWRELLGQSEGGLRGRECLIANGGDTAVVQESTLRMLINEHRAKEKQRAAAGKLLTAHSDTLLFGGDWDLLEQICFVSPLVPGRNRAALWQPDVTLPDGRIVFLDL